MNLTLHNRFAIWVCDIPCANHNSISCLKDQFFSLAVLGGQVGDQVKLSRGIKSLISFTIVRSSVYNANQSCMTWQGWWWRWESLPKPNNSPQNLMFNTRYTLELSHKDDEKSYVHTCKFHVPTTPLSYPETKQPTGMKWINKMLSKRT